MGRLPRPDGVEASGDLVILAVDEKDAKRYETYKPSGGVFDVKVLFDAVFLQQPFNIMNKSHLRLDIVKDSESTRSNKRARSSQGTALKDDLDGASKRKRRRK